MKYIKEYNGHDYYDEIGSLDNYNGDIFLYSSKYVSIDSRYSKYLSELNFDNLTISDIKINQSNQVPIYYRNNRVNINYLSFSLIVNDVNISYYVELIELKDEYFIANFKYGKNSRRYGYAFMCDQWDGFIKVLNTMNSGKGAFYLK